MLFTRFSKILFDKRLGRVFTLKQVAKFFKHVSAELLKPYEKTKSLTGTLKSFAKCLKSLASPLVCVITGSMVSQSVMVEKMRTYVF